MAECTPENVYNLSHFCVDLEVASPDIECFNRKVSPAFTDFVTVWCILNAICGTLGNFLTLVAVPWAAYKKRCGGANLQRDTTQAFFRRHAPTMSRDVSDIHGDLFPFLEKTNR